MELTTNALAWSPLFPWWVLVIIGVVALAFWGAYAKTSKYRKEMLNFTGWSASIFAIGLVVAGFTYLGSGSNVDVKDLQYDLAEQVKVTEVKFHERPGGQTDHLRFNGSLDGEAQNCAIFDTLKDYTYKVVCGQ